MSTDNNKKIKMKEKVYTSYGYKREFDITEEESKKMLHESNRKKILDAYSRFYIDKTKYKKQD